MEQFKHTTPDGHGGPPNSVDLRPSQSPADLAMEQARQTIGELKSMISTLETLLDTAEACEVASGCTISPETTQEQSEEDRRSERISDGRAQVAYFVNDIRLDADAETCLVLAAAYQMVAGDLEAHPFTSDDLERISQASLDEGCVMAPLVDAYMIRTLMAFGPEVVRLSVGDDRCLRWRDAQTGAPIFAVEVR